MEYDQIGQAVILVVAISVMQIERLRVLNHLPTARADALLLPTYFALERCGGSPRQLLVAMLEIRLPLGIEGIGVGLHLDMPLLFHRLLHPDQGLACGRVGEPPCLPWATREVARCYPPAGFMGVAVSRPSLHQLPNIIIQLGEGLGTDDVPMVIRPPP